ncbi:MAG TPA: hypothetical protein DCK95_10760 [Anaerolineaceae bacterium]|nr:hypothetical protein [Anaerolineaceae bacterium]
MNKRGFSVLDEEKYFVEQYNKGGLMFFAGSGICYDSNLPSASSILLHTANVFFPKRISRERKESICSSIQPEVFYEILLNLTRSIDCLKIWRVLLDSEQDHYKINCQPNIVHYFTVDYSLRFNLPIFTTNFDTMFEKHVNI